MKAAGGRGAQLRPPPRRFPAGADYLRENSARDMVDDAMDVVKNNPGVALLGAVALGFLVGRVFSARS